MKSRKSRGSRIRCWVGLIGFLGAASLNACGSAPPARPGAFLTTIPTPTPAVVVVPTVAPTSVATPTDLPSPAVLPTPTALWAQTTTPTPAPAMAVLEEPAAGARVTLPLHIMARVADASSPVSVELDWSDGTKVSGSLEVLADPSGGNLLIGNLDGPPEAASRPTQPAELVLRAPGGAELARQPLTVLGAADPATEVIRLYFVQGNALRAEPRRIPRTRQIATAAVEQLLWGPSAASGLTSALPNPRDVLGYAGRGGDWGPRVRLISVTLAKGVATVDFSKELRAYGGGADRIRLLQAQVTRTLEQFSTIKSVRIAIEGQTQGILQP